MDAIDRENVVAMSHTKLDAYGGVAKGFEVGPPCDNPCCDCMAVDREASHWPTPQDLVEAQEELEEEKVARALEWEKLKQRITELREYLAADCFINYGRLAHNASELVQALRELEKLERSGV